MQNFEIKTNVATASISGSHDFTLDCVVPENSHTPMWRELEIPEVCVCVCVGGGGGGGQ